MTVVCQRARLAYVDVPKAACTSIKTLLFELDGGSLEARRPGVVDRLLGRRQRRRRSVHQIEGYVTRPFAEAGPVPEGHARITVLRDPLSRLYSAWSNKADHATFVRRGEVAALTAAGLSSAPTFGAFLDAFEPYRALSDAVAVHTRPLRWHLGDDLDRYDRVFRMEEMAAFEAWISERAGRPLKLARENRGAGETRPTGFEERHVAVARRILAEDYALLDGHYDFEAGLAAFRRRHVPAPAPAPARAETAAEAGR
jgi:hypothetical protein